MGVLSRIFRRNTETPADRAEWLDRTTRSVAQAAHQRILTEVRTAARSFETAETPAWTESWPTTAEPINQELSRQLPILWARATGLARNNEWAQRYLIDLDDNVLGPAGIQLQMRVKASNGETYDNAVNDEIEHLYDLWCKSEVDVSGMDFADVETLAIHTLPRKGELLYRHMPGAGPMGYQIQMLDPMLLDVTFNGEYRGNRIRLGKEIDDAGKPVAYWLQLSKPGDDLSGYVTVGRRTRFPANEIEHHYIVEEPHQLRGIPWLTVGARRLWMLADFEQAASVASSNAAKRQGFFYSPTGEAPPGFADTIISSVLATAQKEGKVLSPDEIQAITAAAEKYATTVPGQFDTLPLGYQFAPFESKWPEVSSEGYIKQHLRGWAAARGSSYVTIGNDLEAVNYSSAQVGIIAEREHHKKTQGRIAKWLHRRTFARALPYLMLRSRVLKTTDLARYLEAAHWQGRRWAPIDPVKAETANELKLRLRRTSRRRLAAEEGDDFDEIAAEIAAEEAKYGPVQTPGQAAQSAPKKDEES